MANCLRWYGRDRAEEDAPTAANNDNGPEGPTCRDRGISQWRHKRVAMHGHMYEQTVQTRLLGMLLCQWLAEPGLRLEAHRRSPVMSTGTRQDSPHRIACCRRALVQMRDFGVGGPLPLDQSTVVFVFSVRSVIIVIGAAAAAARMHACMHARLGNLQLLVRVVVVIVWCW